MADGMNTLDLATLHRHSKPDRDGKSYPVDIIDDRIAEAIIANWNLFIIGGRFYIYGNGVYKRDENGSIIKTIISGLIYDELRTDARITRVYRLLLSKDVLWIGEDALTDMFNPAVNKARRTVINFKNGLLDTVTMTMTEHSPADRMINQIPHVWERDTAPVDTVVNDFLAGILPDADDREMFLQYVGYAMTTDTHLQKFLIISGEGGTGKSVLLRLVQMAIGSANYSGLTLQNLNDRFSPAFLFGKLINIYADLPSADMSETNGIKTITGEDPVRAEYKGGAVFHFRPYCKLLYSCNQIPKSRDDKTSAYYRRLLIINVKQRGPEIARLEERLAANVDDFIRLAVEAVHRMHTERDGVILESQNSRNAVQQLYMDTDTVTAWMIDCNVIRSPGARIER